MGEMGKAVGLLISGTLVYHHCANRDATRLSLFPMSSSFSYPPSPFSVFFFVNLMSRYPVDPLEWQLSQDTASNIVARLGNTVKADESVLRVAATGHDKRLFVKVVICLYFLAALGRIISGDLSLPNLLMQGYVCSVYTCPVTILNLPETLYWNEKHLQSSEHPTPFSVLNIVQS